MIIKNTGILRNSIFFLALLLLVAAFCIGNNTKKFESDKEAGMLTAKKQFVCSMHPQVVQDQPGDCPLCGMFLIEKIEDKNKADSSLINVIRPVNESVLASVATINPATSNLPLIIEASGTITYDTRKIRTISARFGGLIEKSFVKFQFQPIRKGQKIYEIYCPDVYTERWNYVKLLQMYPDQDNLTIEAREWLTLLGLTTGQIDSLKRTLKPDFHLPVYSDATGYAVSTDFDPEQLFSSGNYSESTSDVSQPVSASLGFNDGLIIETGTPLFKLVDIRSLRADLKIRSEDVGLLKNGQKVILTDVLSPEQSIEATINKVERLNGGLFQLVKVFFTDSEGLLLPGRQIQAHILAGNHEALWLPATAIVNLGQNQSVFAMHDNLFIATTITTGLRSGDKIEILSGIDQNSKIALNALLLTDSDGFINSVSR